jgi:hypothetical protein
MLAGRQDDGGPELQKAVANEMLHSETPRSDLGRARAGLAMIGSPSPAPRNPKSAAALWTKQAGGLRPLIEVAMSLIAGEWGFEHRLDHRSPLASIHVTASKS